MCVKCQFSACEYDFLSLFLNYTHGNTWSIKSTKKLKYCIFYKLFSFRTSLQLCARLGSSRTRLLGVCQLGALQCMGRNFVLARDSDCVWPAETFTSCEDCKPGTICQGESAGHTLKDTFYLLQLGLGLCLLF